MKNNLVECNLGIKVAEKIAKDLDQLAKDLPKDPIYTFQRRHLATKSTEFVDGEKADVSWVTTKTVDLEGEVVLPEGIDLSVYQKNPIVLWNHDAAEPIGRCQWIKQVEGGLKAKTVYASRPQDWQGEWKPDAVYHLVREQVLAGKSIGFLPLLVREPNQEEIKSGLDGRIIERAVLFEYSVVSVPCNSASIVEAVSKGLNPSTLKTLGIEYNRPMIQVPFVAAPVLEQPTQKAKPRTDYKVYKTALARLEQFEKRVDALLDKIK